MSPWHNRNTRHWPFNHFHRAAPLMCHSVTHTTCERVVSGVHPRIPYTEKIIEILANCQLGKMWPDPHRVPLMAENFGGKGSQFEWQLGERAIRSVDSERRHFFFFILKRTNNSTHLHDNKTVKCWTRVFRWFKHEICFTHFQNIYVIYLFSRWTGLRVVIRWVQHFSNTAWRDHLPPTN